MTHAANAHTIDQRIAVSTWSIHRALGITFANGPADAHPELALATFGDGVLTLAELPAELVRRHIRRVEICHFHLASRDPAYLKRIRSAFAASGITIQTLLIDDGDITDPATRARDLAWIISWIEAAAVLGADCARIIAGKQPPTAATLALSIDALRQLGDLGRQRGVRIVTENWFDLLAGPRDVHHVLDALGDSVGFLADTGNWSGAGKYADLSSVFARSQLCHAKCHFGDGLAMDGDDFGRCLTAAAAAGYTGPLTLIFEGSGDEWAGVELERQFIIAHAANSAAASGRMP